MRNRIAHLLKDWENAPDALRRQRPEYPLPRGINMLMPVELSINRELLVNILAASIQEIHRHRQRHDAYVVAQFGLEWLHSLRRAHIG